MHVGSQLWFGCAAFSVMAAWCPDTPDWKDEVEAGMVGICRSLVHLGVSAGKEKAFGEDFKETALLNYLSLCLYSGWALYACLFRVSKD